MRPTTRRRLRIANVILATLVSLIYLVLDRQTWLGIVWFGVALIGVANVWRWHDRRPRARSG